MDEVDESMGDTISHTKQVEATTSMSDEDLMLLEQPEIMKDNFFDCAETVQEVVTGNRLHTDDYIDAYKQILDELDAEKDHKRDEKEDIIRARDAMREEVTELKKRLDEVYEKYSKTSPEEKINNKFIKLAYCIKEYEGGIKYKDERHEALKAIATAILKCAKQSKRVKEEFLAIELEKLHKSLRKYQTLLAVLKDMIRIKSNETIELEDAYDEILSELYLY